MSNQPLQPHGTPGADSRRPSKQFGSQRLCEHDECEVVLSRYNPGRFCAEHDDPRDRKSEAGDGRQMPPAAS